MSAPELWFGQQLRRLRVQRGLSQEALAERAGLAPSAVAALESGARRRPYPRTVGLLAEALELAEVERAAFAQLAGRTPAPAGQPGPVEPTAPMPRLPTWPTSLVGREADVRAIRPLLDPSTSEVRLLSLVGPGGVGKTRLAVAVAAALAPRYPDGVVFVDLAPVREPGLVAATVAHALGVREAGGRGARELLLEHLRERQPLLVLDNLEHLPQAAPLLGELVAACPRLALLVTSRAPLHLSWERRFPVAPLATPPAEEQRLAAVAATPSVHLFVQRVQSAAPEFVLDAEAAATVGAICRRLDGMPLALELAAARVALLTPAALLRRLDRRLAVLTGGARDAPARQHTLRATLAWSHDLLGPAEQVLFRRLAVFAGGWTLEAAEAVCAGAALPSDEVLDGLQALSDSSLVHRLDDGRGEPRFAMLETVREFAEDQLVASGEPELVLARRAAWFVSWSEQVLPELTGRHQRAWFERLADELANFRAVRDWCHADPSRGQSELRLAAALGRYLWTRTPGQEARQWLADALAAGPTGPSPARARALTWCGQLDYLHGEGESGRSRLEQAVAVARVDGDPSLLCLTLRHVALWAADQPTAQVLLDEAAAMARMAGDQRELALALSYSARLPCPSRNLAEACELATHAIEAARAAGDALALTDGLLQLGHVSIRRRDYTTAAPALQEALDVSEQLGHRRLRHDPQSRARLSGIGAARLTAGARSDPTQPRDGARIEQRRGRPAVT